MGAEDKTLLLSLQEQQMAWPSSQPGNLIFKTKSQSKFNFISAQMITLLGQQCTPQVITMEIKWKRK